MSLPLTLPDWLPWWVPIVLLVPALLYALAFLFMPFSMIGVKGRLGVIEARLDEIQQEIRHLALRLPETGQEVDYHEVFEPRAEPTLRRPPVVDARPPIPPAAHDLDGGDGDRPAPPPHARPARREPRLDWRR